MSAKILQRVLRTQEQQKGGMSHNEESAKEKDETIWQLPISFFLYFLSDRYGSSTQLVGWGNLS